MTLFSDKASLRRHFLAARSALDAKTRLQASAAINSHLTAFLTAKCPGQVAIYAAHRGEPDVMPLAADWPTALPVVAGPGVLNFFAWQPGDPLAPNQYGIMEPVKRDAVSLTDADVVIVPSVGLDRRGWRLGYGGGFYDRLLEHTHVFAIGVAFDCCLVDALPLEEHDQPLAAVVTERGLTVFPPRPGSC